MRVKHGELRQNLGFAAAPKNGQFKRFFFDSTVSFFPFTFIMRRERLFNVQQAIEMITEYSDDNAEIDLSVITPEEGKNAESEDEEETLAGEHQQLPNDVAGELKLHIHRHNKEAASSSLKSSRRWNKTDKVGLSPSTAELPSLDEKFPLLCVKTCYNTFRLYCDNDMIDLIIEETERYAREIKNIHDFFTSRNEILAFIGVLLYSGYVKLPNEAHYWSTSEDFDLSLCSSYFLRDRFKKIKSCLHFADNNNLSENRVKKN